MELLNVHVAEHLSQIVERLCPYNVVNIKCQNCGKIYDATEAFYKRKEKQIVIF